MSLHTQTHSAIGSDHAIIGGSANTFLKCDTGANTLVYCVLSAGLNIGFTYTNSGLVIGATGGGAIYAATENQYLVLATATDLSAERVLVASTGLTSVDAGAGGNFSLSVNTNVRDKMFTFVAVGPLGTTMLAEGARIRIPFTCQPIRADIAVVTTPLVFAITADFLEYASPAGTGTSYFTAANRMFVNTNTSVGSSLTFNLTQLTAGSFLGFDIVQVGTATAPGTTATLTFVVRTS